MGKVQVNNIRLYAFHGCLEEEAAIGSWYRVDVEVEGDLTKSSTTDELNDTIDYVHLNSIVKEEMEKRSKLLECVAQRILDRFFDEISILEKAQVGVTKINPPIGGNVEEVTVILHQTRTNTVAETK
jgi:dihydroneopterin aldolase